MAIPVKNRKCFPPLLPPEKLPKYTTKDSLRCYQVCLTPEKYPLSIIQTVCINKKTIDL